MAQQLSGHKRNIESGQKFKKATASAGASATLTIAAEADEIHILDRLWFSWSGVGALAATGTITITVDGDEIFNQDVANSGIGPLELGHMTKGVKNKEVVIVLSAVTGLVPKLTVKYW